MAKRTIETNLMGDVVQFDTVPNHDLSDGVGTIRGVYAPKGQRPPGLRHPDGERAGAGQADRDHGELLQGDPGRGGQVMDSLWVAWGAWAALAVAMVLGWRHG
jgi:hypothetical protein